MTSNEPLPGDTRRAEWLAEFRKRPESAVLAERGLAPYRCPCCGQRTLPRRGRYDGCQVCMWVDDGQDDPFADEVWGGPNRTLSLSAARRNFVAFGARDRDALTKARPPRQDEL